MGLARSRTGGPRPFAAAGERIAPFARPPLAPAPRSTLATVLDELGIAACVFGLRDLELHRSTRMRDVLATEPGGGRLLAALRALARELLERSSELPAGCVAHGVARADGARGAYQLRGVALPAGGAGPEPVAVVELGLAGPALPRADDLVARRGLTPREAEVALHLAVGESDREVARALSISPHTVRKHAEHIYDKLRLHSRRALLLRLSGDDWPRLAAPTAPVLRQRGGVPHRDRARDDARDDP